MNTDTNEMKKRLGHQIAEDFNSRFESNEQKLERLRQLQKGNIELPIGLDVDGEIRIPTVADTHDMLLGGVMRSLGPTEIPAPKESATKRMEPRSREADEGSSTY